MLLNGFEYLFPLASATYNNMGLKPNTFTSIYVFHWPTPMDREGQTGYLFNDLITSGNGFKALLLII